MTFPELISDCAKTAYPEPRSPIHDQIGQAAVQWVSGILKPGSLIIDLGCGSAFCSVMFKELGHRPVAVSVLKKEVEAAQGLGLTAIQLEMHSEQLPHICEHADLLWLRHVAEHSPCPLLLLNNCREAAAPAGLLYLEVPMPWTSCIHEANANHYSVLNTIAWENLLRRSGWLPLVQNSWPIITQQGPDCYHSFICKRK